jgi:hypothetical protein
VDLTLEHFSSRRNPVRKNMLSIDIAAVKKPASNFAEYALVGSTFIRTP